MYHHVPEHYHAVSERVSNILDVIGYSQETRDRKVINATGYEVFTNIYHTDDEGKSYMFGSRGKGTTGPGLQSDHDILIYDDRSKIIKDLSGFQQGKQNFLLVQDERTHPGYVKLQRVTILPENSPVPNFHYQDQMFRVDSYGRTVISNDVYQYILHGISVTGPALHATFNSIEVSADYVFTIRCTQWPNEAHEWILRRRPHQLPKADHMRNARKDGRLAAPVGYPHIHEQDLEWTLSFSITERKLIRSLEDTAMKVYILLKMIQKTYI